MRHPLLVCLLTAFTASAHAASFPCTKAQRPVEKVICGNLKLNATDESLGRTYRVQLGRLSADGVSTARADQVQWLAWAQQVCRANGPTAVAAATVQCLLPLYEERTKQLRTLAVQRDGLTFLTRTQYLAEPDKETLNKGSAEHAGFGTLQASWPAADLEDPKWMAWNQAVEADAFALAGGNGDGSAKNVAPQKPVWTSSLAGQQDITVFGQVKSVEHNRVTTSLNTESMGQGAAHPNESFETMTWLLESGRPLRAEDVFAPASTWKRQVAAACWKAITTSEQKTYIYPEVTGPNAKPLQDVIADIRNWTLEADGLHISYPEYSVAPRVSPVEDTVLGWAQLKPVLAPGFVAP